MNGLEHIIAVGDNFGKQAPNRDRVLEKIYEFMRALSDKDITRASGLVISTSMDEFRFRLDMLLRPYWREMANEVPDPEWDLSQEISDPHFINEADSRPEFSNSGFDLTENEVISIRVGIKGEVIPVCLNFSISKHDEIYFLRLKLPSNSFSE